jgi:hypothetical protein
MKRLTMTSMVAAALFALAAGSASAQMLKAEIPFAFQMGQAIMSPGAYEVTVNALSRSVSIRNVDTKHSALAMYNLTDPAKAWTAGSATLQFVCSGGRCALGKLWTGSDYRAYFFHTPKLARDAEARITEIALTPVKAD